MEKDLGKEISDISITVERVSVNVDHLQKDIREMKGVLKVLSEAMPTLRNDLNITNEAVLDLKLSRKNHSERLKLIEDDILKMNTILKFIWTAISLIGLPTVLYICYQAFHVLMPKV